MTAPTPSTATAVPLDYLRLIRPKQWTKNLLVGAAFFFAYWDRLRPQPLGLDALTRVIPAVALFCIVSSGIYVLNDLKDREADRRHPVKCKRPIAAGLILPGQALIYGIALLSVGLIAALILARPFALVLGVYVLLQIAYTLLLKEVALVDIMIIAGGFVLRAIAGAMVLPGVTISPWLLLCTFVLALFLALCKRRHEKGVLGDESTTRGHRVSLLKYEPHLLDQLIAITAGTTIVCYAIYTLWPDTVDKFGTSALGFTIPYVVFGVFRYLDLVYRHEEGGRPEKILLTDTPILINLVLYVATLTAIFLIYR